MKSLHIAGMLALLAAPLVGATQVGAATATASLTVTATVAGTCTISATSMAFGTLSTTADNNPTATVTYNCSNGTYARITADQGQNWANASSDRVMVSGSNRLNYQLYLASERSRRLDDYAGAFDRTGTGSDATVTIYGRVRAADAAAAAPGNYTDTVTLTITY
jgi:spore coat protein U-like protein